MCTQCGDFEFGISKSMHQGIMEHACEASNRDMKKLADAIKILTEAMLSAPGTTVQGPRKDIDVV